MPKFSELTDISAMVNKMKAAFENLTGPSTSSVTEEALEKESNPQKAKLLEIELLINQLNDLTIIQNKTVHELQSKYAEVKAMVHKELFEEPPAAAKTNEAKNEAEAIQPEQKVDEQPTEVNETADKQTAEENPEPEPESSPENAAGKKED